MLVAIVTFVFNVPTATLGIENVAVIVEGLLDVVFIVIGRVVETAQLPVAEDPITEDKLIELIVRGLHVPGPKAILKVAWKVP